jgi:hypothetical protein
MPSDAARACLMWCSACGGIVTCSRTDLIRYVREGWPRCCGPVMGYFSEACRPDPDDTKADRPTA